MDDLQFKKVQDELINKITSKESNKFDEIFELALNKKGFYFNTKAELQQFAKDRCKCRMFSTNSKKIFTVDDLDFLLQDFSFPHKLSITHDPYTITTNAYEYSFM